MLSAHLLIIDPDERLGQLAPDDYDNELLHMAHDLANRLIPAFDNTTTGLPHPRVSLMRACLQNEQYSQSFITSSCIIRLSFEH